jgi:hypothetical protein
MTAGRHNAGQALPLIAMSLAVLLGFAGLSVDVGYLQYWEQQQQSATDAAALGGAEYHAHSNCASATNAQDAALADANQNGFPNAGNLTVTASSPPQSGPYAGNGCAVAVQITSQHVATFFSRLFGYPNGMAESTQAVAAAVNAGPGCIYLLSPSSSSIFNGDTVNAPQCGILINNDTATFNGDPTFDAAYIGYAGSAPIENGTTFTGATPAPMPPVNDPCSEIAGCAYLTANPPSTGSCTSQTYNGLSSVTIPEGCYNSIIVNGCTNVTFQSGGLFIFNGTTIINGETSVTGSGVTLYVTAFGGAPTFNGISNVSLSPPTSGNYSGVLYYQVPTKTTAPIFNGVSQSLSGLIYAPAATGVIFNGTSGGYLVIVVGSATFNGSAAYDFATPPPGQSILKDAVIVQ